MDKINEITKQFINTSNFYIREIKKGKDKISHIYLELLNGSNNVVPCFIHTKDNKVLGNIIVERNNKDLELQVISSEIYNLFNVFAPLTFYLYNDDGSRAVLDINPQNEREIYCSSYELITNLVNEIKRGIITIPSYLKDYLTILRDNKEVINDIDIIKLIEVSINALDRKYGLKDKDKERLLKSFLELIIVDYITLNNNRNTDTYAFLINKINDKINVTPSYLKRLNIDKEDYSLNGIVVKYNNLLKVLFNNYYDYIKILVKSIIDNRNVYEKCINLIVDANSSLDNSNIIKEEISNRLDQLLLLDNEWGMNNSSKIDLVLTKTNVNLKVVNKTSEILAKYQNYEKVEIKDDNDSNLVINYDLDEEEGKHKGILIYIIIVGFIVGLLYIIFAFINR